MSHDLLRDVLRTGDRCERTRRRLSILPISIALHACGVAALLIAPLAAEVVPPVARPPSRDALQVIPAVMPSVAPPSRVNAPARGSRDAAPVAIPDGVEPERPDYWAGAPGSPVDGAIPLGAFGPPGALVESTGTLPPLAPAPARATQPVRVSDGIRAPQKIHDVAPRYPVLAQRARVAGTVILEAVIDERGHVSRVRVLRSVPLLDEAAVEAVRGWRYTPTLLSGVPVPVLMTVSVHFTLRE